MSEITILSPSEQVAAHLRGEILRGRWSETMPGVPTLVAELGIDGKTVAAALGLLETDGILVAQGTGRPRRIDLPTDTPPPALRVAILDYEPQVQTEEWSISMQKQLMNQGHNAFFTEKSLTELGMDVSRIARMVKKTKADAWVVCAGSREVLEWFVKQETPAFALFGRRRDLPMAGVGPDHVAACRVATQRLIALGHKRIVVLVRESQRTGGPGIAERAIFEEMNAHGLPSGPYNLPEWKNTPEDFHRVLDELFRVTPPTALIIDEPVLFHAAKEHLAQHGILAPAQVSLISRDPDPTFAWSQPSVAHVRWDHRPVVRRVLRWVAKVSRGQDDRRQTLTKAEFVEGGTVGPAPQ